VAVVAIRSVLLIVNPASRRGRRALPRALAAFKSAGVACEVHETTAAGHAESIARERAATHDAVFTLGGDGTAMEVLHAMQGRDEPVGILPGGTGNLVARALGTPRRVRAAVRALLAGSVRTVDLAQMPDGRVFAFAAGMGIDSTMVQRTSAGAKRRFGVLAYVLSAVRAALALDGFALTATVDGQRHDFHATAVLLANFGNLFGGLFRVGPAVRENDGMLDLCVFTPSNVGDALRVGWRLLRHDFGTDPAMHFLQGRVVALESDPPRQAQADGELLPGTGVQATVIPGGARLLAPAGR